MRAGKRARVNIKLTITFLVLIIAGIYLFVTAPPPLEDHERRGRMYSINEAFSIVAKENDLVRAMYTKSIVGHGKEKKLQFNEAWKEDSVEAGPLPALFLRGVSASLEKSPVPLSLFLGSDFPISSANKFTGKQEGFFNQIKKDKKPKFFFDISTKRYTAMFPDYATVLACVTCHNQHAQSPKKDWVVGDIMGATTWSYPEDSVSLEELSAIILSYREGVNHTYNTYLAKTKTFKKNPIPEIGTKWPRQGYNLPSLSVFMDSVNKLAAPYTLISLINKNPKK